MRTALLLSIATVPMACLPLGAVGTVLASACPAHRATETAAVAGTVRSPESDAGFGGERACWSGDPSACAGAARALGEAKSAATSMLPTCALGTSDLFGNGFEPGAAATGAQPWSDPATWGGAVPVAGQSVLIPAGRTVVLDVATPVLATLTVEGRLVGAIDRDIAVSANVIMVHGGEFRVGCAEQRHERMATITLVGPPSAANPHDMGTKVLGAMAGGRIELHGRSVTAWSRLAAPASAGSTTIRVADATGWRVGDRIVIASGSSNPDHAEVRTITAVNGAWLALDAALARPRPGERQVVDGRTLDLRTEVGLLTRNIVVQGDVESAATRFGGHVMVMAGSQARIDGVQFLRMGQFDRLGRYPLHWHLVGDAGGQYVRNAAVDGSFLRGIILHGTRGVLVESNVVHDSVGHNYVVEDAASVGNILRANLAVGNRLAFTTDPELVTQNDDQAANFWIRSARNTFVDNVAAGSAASGYWFDHTLDGPTTFRGNVAHSAAARGDHVVFNRQAGLLVENATEDPSVPALVFEDNLFHRNATGIWPTAEPGTAPQVHRRVVLADHDAGFPMVSEAVGARVVFEDPLFVGTSSGEPGFRQPPVHLQYGAAVDLVRPVYAHWGSTHLISANDIFADWQADFRISGARFIATSTDGLLAEGTVLQALDGSYVPAGTYVDGRWPQLAGPGSIAVTLGGKPLWRFSGPVGHAFLRLRAGGASVHGNAIHLVRNDGLRFAEANDFGYRVAYAPALSYRYESLPTAASEFGVRLDLVGALQRSDAGSPRAGVVLPLGGAPSSVFRPADAEEGWSTPGAGNALVAAATLAEFEASPLTRYHYDAATQRLHVMASERWVVVRR